MSEWVGLHETANELTISHSVVSGRTIYHDYHLPRSMLLLERNVQTRSEVSFTALSGLLDSDIAISQSIFLKTVRRTNVDQ